jgi:N-acetylglutamate synthase
MQGAALLDELMANAWRPLTEELRGDWRFRWTDGVTRRANSVLAIGAAEPLEDLVAHAEDFYGRRGAPTLVQVTTASAPRGLSAFLRSNGYRATAATLVEEAATAVVVERTESRFDVAISTSPSDEWFDTYWSVESSRGLSESDMALCREVLLAPELPMVFTTAFDGSEALGVGQLVIKRGWAGVQCMATRPSGRRKGLARAVLNGLATEAAQRGIGRMYLAVMATNDAAAALYSSAGFTTSHEYCYFKNQPT